MGKMGTYYNWGGIELYKVIPIPENAHLSAKRASNHSVSGENTRLASILLSGRQCYYNVNIPCLKAINVVVSIR